MSSFLQSPAWRVFQESLGREVIEEHGNGWSFLAIVELASGFRRLYCPYGPVIGSFADLQPALDALRKCAVYHRAHYCRIQPTGYTLNPKELQAHGLTPIYYSQPVRTWMLDITPSIDGLYAEMKQNTRNICRNYQKKGMRYRQSTDPRDIMHLTSLLRGVAAHNHIAVHPDTYFQAQAAALFPIGAAKLHSIDYEDQVIAAALTYYHEDTVTYGHAAADFTHRKLGASTALVGEIIQTAKADGYQLLDFFGIAPTDDPDHKQAGFTRFKQSFGGFEQHYSPTCEFGVAPLAYQAYRALRRLRSLS